MSSLCLAMRAFGLAVAASLLGGAPAARADDTALEVVADGLDQIAAIARLPERRLLVVEIYQGTVQVIDRDGQVGAEPFLDLSDRTAHDQSHEEGLLDVEPAPDFEASGVVYATYTTNDREFVLARLRDGTEERLLRLDSDNKMHWCGDLVFGADGYLYVCIGDMTGMYKPDYSPSQDLGQLGGKLLRIDVSEAGTNGRPYGIPEDNPFVDDPGARPEIWAYGLRNPWRFAFDPESGALWMPDVSQVAWEEVNRVADGGRGRNLGWPLAEAGDCMQPYGCGEDFVWPVFEYPHSEGRCSVIGAAVYQGQRSPAWAGAFVFGDWCGGQLWAILDGRVRRLEPATFVNPTAIANDHDGEILISDGASGTLYRLVLPEDLGAGWQPVEQVVMATVMAARREGLGGGVLTLDGIMRTPRWQVITRMDSIVDRLQFWAR